MSESTGRGSIQGPAPVRGGTMLVSETGTTLRTVKKLVKGRVYCKLYKDKLSMEKNFGGA
jgi:hypothetical protein